MQRIAHAPSLLLLIAAFACETQGDASTIHVRSAHIDADLQYYDVVVDGHEREVFMAEQPDGDQLAAIVDDADHGVVVLASAAACDDDRLACTLAESAFSGELAQLADEQVDESFRLPFFGCDLDSDLSGNYACLTCDGPFSTSVDCWPA